MMKYQVLIVFYTYYYIKVLNLNINIKMKKISILWIAMFALIMSWCNTQPKTQKVAEIKPSNQVLSSSANSSSSIISSAISSVMSWVSSSSSVNSSSSSLSISWFVQWQMSWAKNMIWSEEITFCDKSQNANTKKKVLIKLSEIKDPVLYEKKRKEAVDLINDCYEVQIEEEYEVQPWEVSTQWWSFKYKIIDSDNVFDKLMFYPSVNVVDFEWFMWTQAVKYITNDSREEILKFYEWIQIPWYKSTPSDSEDVLRWTDIDTTNKTITLTITPVPNVWNYLVFDYSEPMAQ